MERWKDVQSQLRIFSRKVWLFNVWAATNNIFLGLPTPFSWWAISIFISLSTSPLPDSFHLLWVQEILHHLNIPTKKTSSWLLGILQNKGHLLAHGFFGRPWKVKNQRIFRGSCPNFSVEKNPSQSSTTWSRNRWFFSDQNLRINRLQNGTPKIDSEYFGSEKKSPPELE